MPRRVTIYLQDEVNRLIENRVSKLRGLSPTIAEIIERYDTLCTQAHKQVRLDDAEWSFLLKILKSWKPDRPALLRESLLARLESQREPNRLNVTLRAIYAELERMTYPELVAVVDAAERFWSARDRGEIPTLPRSSTTAVLK